jgi:PST family polysaccharide transporter
VFLAIELSWACVNVAATALLVPTFGLAGAGMAFLIAYVFHALVVFPTARWLTGFRWSRACLRTGTLFLVSIAVVFASFHELPLAAATMLGGVATVASAFYSVVLLVRLVPPEEVPGPVRRILQRLSAVRRPDGEA